jgi:hypothetical protein
MMLKTLKGSLNYNFKSYLIDGGNLIKTLFFSRNAKYLAALIFIL